MERVRKEVYKQLDRKDLMEDGGETSQDIMYEKGGGFNKESGLKKLAKEKKATITNAFDQLKKSIKADQYKIVRTSEFKNWFGDWQKDPNNCSVVRENNGEPMVVWHGSPSKFNIFKNVENGVFYFAENAGYASHFADGTKNTYPYFLNIRKIFDALKFDIKEYEANVFIKDFGINTKWLKSQDKLNKRIKFWELLRHDEDFRKYLIKQGYDGVRYIEDNDDSWIEKSVAYGCFNANQIKLANGVNTTFSIKSKDIRYADGGETSKEITCVNCGWHWNTKDSDPSDKYVCHKCGFDNRTYYDSDPISKMEKQIALPDTYATYDNLKPILERQGYQINKMIKVGGKLINSPDFLKGKKEELEEHRDVFEKLRKNKLTADQAAELVVLEHLKKKPDYYKEYSKGGKIKLQNKNLISYKEFLGLDKRVKSPYADENDYYYPMYCSKEKKTMFFKKGNRRNNSITPQLAYKSFLFHRYKVDFKDLSAKQKNALMLGKQSILEN